MRSTASSSTRTKLYWAITTALTTTLAAPLAFAQDAPSNLEEIQVTGSRIRAVDGMTAPTPVTAMTVGELTDFNPGSTVAAQLDELPQFFDTPNAQRGGNAISTTAGGSYLNLRGMGLNRTLVLVDGTRVAPADANGSVNVDIFPSALMQRIDVVTGGASAAYGADAVAGVVNFVLDREFEGLRARVSTGITEEMDGENYNFSVAGGKAFMDNRLHLISSVEARQIDQIGPGTYDRLDNWKDWGLVRNPNYVSATATPNEPIRVHAPYVFSAQANPAGLILAPTGAPGFAYTNWTFTDDGSDIRPYNFGDYLSLSGAGAQNNQSGGQEYKYYDLGRQAGPRGNEVKQRSAFLGAKFDVTDSFRLTGQIMAGRSESNYYGQKSGMALAGSLYSFKIYRDNAYLPSRLADEMDRLGLDMIRMSPSGVIDGPGLVNIYDNRGDRSVQSQYIWTLGFDWDLNDNWNLNGTYQFGESKVQTGILNVPRIDKFFLAMDAVRDPATGNIVCNIALRNPSPAELKASVEGKRFPSPIDPLGVEVDSPLGPLNPQDCVPFNPFGIGNANLAAKAWILDPEKKQVRVLEQDFAELLLTGVLYEGWGAGPISIAAGLTWRDENFTQINRPAYGERGLLNVPDLGIRAIPDGFAGDGNRSLHPFSAIGVGDGSKDVWEWYTELNVPIWEWDSGQSIGSSLAYRSSDYSGAGRQESWKIGVDVQLLDSLRWRATKSSDIREPNFAEIFLTGTGGGAVDDPFRGNERNGALTALSTSNPALGAETGETITTGFVWRPTFASWIDGLQVSVDWYEINLDGAVAAYGIQRIVDDCFATGAASACNLIQRLPPTGDGYSIGPISRILNQNINADKAQTRGVDLEVGYRFEPNFFADQEESFNLRSILGFLDENSTTTAAGTTTDLAGSQSRPEISGVITGTYTVGPWGFMLQSSYYDDVMLNSTWVEGVDVDDNKVESMTTFNSSIFYSGETSRGHSWRAAFNVTNLFGRDPPIVAGAAGQSIIAGHDSLGRRYQLSLNYDF
ncbi:MAG TPA: TonB-dependent receptor [Hyphomicrobiales bacterium]|nr:TonB-dependent receptor [Hyphomicrobiales bacterium]